jgi:hypothetical protein
MTSTFGVRRPMASHDRTFWRHLCFPRSTFQASWKGSTVAKIGKHMARNECGSWKTWRGKQLWREPIFFCWNIGSEILGRPSLNIPRLFHSLQFNIARPHGTHRIGCASTDRNGCHIMIWWALRQFANVFNWALRLWRFFHKFLLIGGLEFKRMQWRHQNWTWNLTRCDIATVRLPGPS